MDTHAESGDPNVRLYPKSLGIKAKLNFMGHLLPGNRSSLIGGATDTEAGARKDWQGAIELLSR